MSLDLTPGHGNLLGESYWEMTSPWLGGSSMLNTGPAPLSEEDVYSLSQILQDDPPHKYYLSRRACLGILRRARERGKELPPQLKTALMAQAGLAPLMDIPVDSVAFAANQRDEVRGLHDVAGALSAQTIGAPMRLHQSGSHGERSHSGMSELSPQGWSEGYGACGDEKQQTFVAQECLTPWDTQQARIFTPESKAPTLASADGGGGRNPGGLLFTAGFCAGASPAAGSIGYQEEVSPTLKASASGNMMPSVLCLNDQGGSVMECSEDVAGTLRAQEHGHQPLVLYDNHGKDARYKGPLNIAPTVVATYGTGGNNQPLVSSSVFTRKRVDVFRDDDVASTESARQHKDATDLICQPTYQETVGALTSSDRKGPNSQYVGQDKLIVDGPLLIRRLTPLECERLQGFPDFWTDLPGTSDSSRYKALGNSVAIPCVEYIMWGIAMAVLPRQ